jgi:hypothetical protein
MKKIIIWLKKSIMMIEFMRHFKFEHMEENP